MCIIELNASKWRNGLEFYHALKEALGSCEGHGDSPAAFVDSMVWGGMNVIEAPYVVRISGTSNCNDDLRRWIVLLADDIHDARMERKATRGDDIDVSIEVLP